MRTMKMLKRARIDEVGNVITHAITMGWTPEQIRKHGNPVVRKALAGGVAQPAVAYTPKTERPAAPTRARSTPKKRNGKRTAPKVRAGRRVEEPVTKGADFSKAEQFPIRVLRNGEYRFGNLYILPARAKATGKGLTHDVQYHVFFGETVHIEQKTLSALALTRFLGGERTEQWLDGHGYVVTRVMPEEMQ